MTRIITFFLLLSAFTAQAQDIFEGVVAYYPFNGTAQDESTFDHNGQVFGATLTEDRFGNPESAYAFNGTDNFIRVEHSEAFNFGTSDPYAVSIWFQASQEQQELTVPGNDVLSKWFIDGEMTQSAGYTLVLRYNNQIAENPFVMRALRFDGYGGCVNVDAVGTEIVKEIWHHVVFTYEEGEFKFYYDNKLMQSVQETSLTCSTQNQSPLLIGKRGAAPHPNHFTGAIDDLRIYERALSEEEITLLFEEGQPSNINGLEMVDFKIYPNPTDSSLSLELPETTDVQSIKIVDLTGKIVREEMYENGNKVHLGNLPSGVYFLNLFNSENQFIGRKKFVKAGGNRA